MPTSAPITGKSVQNRTMRASSPTEAKKRLLSARHLICNPCVRKRIMRKHLVAIIKVGVGIMKKRVFAVTLIMLFTLLMASGAFAAMDLTREDGRIIVALVTESGDTPLRNIQVSLYRVGDVELVNGEYSFSRAGDFRNANVTLVIETSAQHANQAALLVTYARSNRLTPIETKSTDTNGRVEFNDLGSGLYLVMQTSANVSGGYVFDPVLIPLPYLTQTTDTAGTWEFEVTSRPKTEYVPPPETPPPTTPPTTPPVTPPVTPPPESPQETPPPASSELVEFDNEVPLASVPSEEPAEELFIPEQDVPLGNLPQTGLLIWPIAVFLIAGIVIVVAGIIVKNRKRAD